jgi:hypothetical protein
MTENFNNAASVLLSRRLNNLLRINESIEIDMSYVTCAEYQLFIHEKSDSGKNLYPEHWNNYRFPNGYAKKPVTGVRAIYAEEFCKWLTQRESSLLYKYRLPNLDEVYKYPLEENDFGYWCRDRDKIIIQGINQINYRVWAKALSDIFHNSLKYVHDIDILFGTNLINFASKIQVATKNLEYPDINDFVRKIYSLSIRELENVNLVKIINELEKLNDLKEILNINNSKLTFIKFADSSKQAVFETLKSIKINTVDNFIFQKNKFEVELNSILKKLHEFERLMKAKKSDLFVDMEDEDNNLIFIKEKIKLINPITGQDESIDIPSVNYQTTLMVNFKNLQWFIKEIATIKKELQSLQTKTVEERNSFININNQLEKEKKLYNENLSKIPQAQKTMVFLEDNNFHLLIVCAICLWVEKRNLAEEIFELYLYLILLKERREGRIPTWEGIRIVRERF